MKFSDSNIEIIKALFNARQKFTKVKKDKTNSHLKNKYATLDSVLDAIMPALTDDGIFETQGMSDENLQGQIKLITRFTHVESGQWVEYYTTLPIQKNDPQGLGSAMTYARRYALVAALGLSQADDDAQLAVKSAQDWKKDLDQCEDLVTLKDTFGTAYKQSDAANRVIIKEHYDKLKAKLEISSARGFNPAAPAANIAKNEGVEKQQQQEVKSQPITDFE